ncbi:MAG: 5-(carboxyamino)imidazole ribonucleotide mutase [Candidatus Thermoplasmatota archaeon]|nr:5-(carboxyamino)imidazole ribonucleotide mutase [Candidatus Thermoplasmatota archaeon]
MGPFHEDEMDVLIVLGSISDKAPGERALQLLKEFGLNAELVIASAHRTPQRLRQLVEGSDAAVFIAMAGMSAALPGTVASLTLKPVIGVPLSGKLNLDSILSVTQMPPGVPVAAVSLDGAENAALLAIEILALSDSELGKRLKVYRDRRAQAVAQDSKKIGG